jgi:hypothetical protein
MGVNGRGRVLPFPSGEGWGEGRAQGPGGLRTSDIGFRILLPLPLGEEWGEGAAVGQGIDRPSWQLLSPHPAPLPEGERMERP